MSVFHLSALSYAAVHLALLTPFLRPTLDPIPSVSFGAIEHFVSDLERLRRPDIQSHQIRTARPVLSTGLLIRRQDCSLLIQEKRHIRNEIQERSKGFFALAESFLGLLQFRPSLPLRRIPLTFPHTPQFRFKIRDLSHQCRNAF
jgi:hypothetical protein